MVRRIAEVVCAVTHTRFAVDWPKLGLEPSDGRGSTTSMSQEAVCQRSFFAHASYFADLVCFLRGSIDLLQVPDLQSNFAGAAYFLDCPHFATGQRDSPKANMRSRIRFHCRLHGDSN